MTDHQIAALLRLWEVAQRDHGGARVCARLLLGLYNGSRFPFDLTDLRLLDETVLEDALTVIRMDARPAMEVHDLIGQFTGAKLMGYRFEILACDWRMKGRCKKEYEAECRAAIRALRPPVGLGAIRHAQMLASGAAA